MAESKNSSLTSHFERNVFLNCPFDQDYRQFLEPLLFTIAQCGLVPRIASERQDSSESRMEKILGLIESSKYSIHDLSRFKSSEAGEFYRLNMPFEIGLDFACKRYHPDQKYREKRSLILEPERHILHKALSDLSGFDVKSHENSVSTLILEVRNWFSTCGAKNLKSPRRIQEEFLRFKRDYFQSLQAQYFSAEEIGTLPIGEFLSNLNDWNEQTEI